MSNQRNLRALPPLPMQSAPAVVPVPCPWCGALAAGLTNVRVVAPQPLAADAEPTPEHLAAQARGHQIIMGFACHADVRHVWQLVVIQAPGKPAVIATTDGHGALLDQADLARRRQRQAAVTRLIVPGRN